ncbi:MAG: UbiX family flavin prenyltransferase [Methanomassiliicoccales archaeon]
MRRVVAITGSSGVIYGIRLLQELQGEKLLVISEMGKKLIETETNLKVSEVEDLADRVLDNADLFASIASGSFRHDGMAICPCSMNTLGKVSTGLADNLISRAAAVCLKERRRLVVVPRETPMDAIMLENQMRLAQAGAIILPACPGFYRKPASVDEMIDFVVGKTLDALGQDNDLYQRWQ